jgi:chromosome segregation ATPase
MDEDLNTIRLARLKQKLKEMKEMITRIDKSNDASKSQLNELQSGLHEMEEPKIDLHNSIEKIKNNTFFLENI